MGLLMIVAMLLAVNYVVFGADKTITLKEFNVKVLEQSGTITIYKSNENDPNMVTITFDYIKERTSDGEAITGANTHSYNNFASLNYTFSSISLKSSFWKFNIKAEFEIEAGTTTTLVNYVYLFTNGGIINVNGEELKVKKDDVKFDVRITDWPFCGQGNVTCLQGQTPIVGAFLDFAIEMKGSGTTAASSSDCDTYELGGGAKVFVSRKYLI